MQFYNDGQGRNQLHSKFRAKQLQRMLHRFVKRGNNYSSRKRVGTPVQQGGSTKCISMQWEDNY